MTNVRLHFLKTLVLAAGLSGVGLASAGATTVTTQATDDIWLAGQPNGTSITGNFGSDTAPAASPVLVSVTSGSILVFSASGSTSVDGSCFAGPDGGCYSNESSFSPSPWSGYYIGPADALVGVFMNSSAPAAAGLPATLDYTDPAVISQLSFAPVLNAIFFIGDGLTGTGTGTSQQFTVPTGANELFLAAADSYGASSNNVGSLTVSASALGVTAVPEPASLGLLGAALGLVGLTRQRATRMR